MGLRKGQRHKGSFKKGWKGGPGKPKLDPDILAIRKSTREELCAWFKHFSQLEPEEKKALKPGDFPLLAAGIYRALSKFSRSGHSKDVEYLLNQIIGKPRESIEVTGKDGEPMELTIWKERLKDKLERNADNHG